MEEGGYALTTAELAAAYVASDSEVAIKVPFEDVADIVAKRECLLDEGDAIALVDSLPQFVSSVFVRHVDIKLASCRRLARMLRASDDRLDRLLSFLSQQLGEMTLLLSSAMRRGYNRAALSGPAMTLERLERVRWVHSCHAMKKKNNFPPAHAGMENRPAALWSGHSSSTLGKKPPQVF